MQTGQNTQESWHRGTSTPRPSHRMSVPGGSLGGAQGVHTTDSRWPFSALLSWKKPQTNYKSHSQLSQNQTPTAPHQAGPLQVSPAKFLDSGHKLSTDFKSSPAPPVTTSHLYTVLLSRSPNTPRIQPPLPTLTYISKASCLAYCNSTLTGLLASAPAPLCYVLNRAARSSLLNLCPAMLLLLSKPSKGSPSHSE